MDVKSCYRLTDDTMSAKKIYEFFTNGSAEYMLQMRALGAWGVLCYAALECQARSFNSLAIWLFLILYSLLWLHEAGNGPPHIAMLSVAIVSFPTP
jgi:hypothetical protein